MQVGEDRGARPLVEVVDVLGDHVDAGAVGPPGDRPVSGGGAGPAPLAGAPGYLQTHGTPYTQNTPLHAVVHLLHRLTAGAAGASAPERLAALRQRLPAYLSELQKYRLDDAALDAERRGSVAGLLNLVLGFPIWIFGALTNYLPYVLPSMIAHRATKDLEFVAPIMMVVGMFTFSLGYAIELSLAQHFLTHDWRWTTLLGLLLPVAGFYALSYWQALAARWRRLRARLLPAPVRAQLLAQRAEVLRLLDEARVAYLAQ